jgi:glyoxylase-like metal-dependent hydrolase (beta-lactamase superfamily II)
MTQAGRAALPAFVEPVDDGLWLVDTGFHRHRFAGAYLIVDRGRAAFVDTGTNFGVPRLLAALDALGLERDAVDWVVPTHVHLDHAGGVGRLMRSLPAARMLVHPRGVRHVVDPTALYQGALEVYGQAEMDRSYGRLEPVDAARVVASAEGMTIEVGQRVLECIDTPGHARHHHCIWDARSQGWFTGDTFGLSYREFDTAAGALMLPTTTPVQFEPPVLRHSIERLLARRPRAMYLTHFGRVGEVDRMAAALLAEIDAMVEIGLAQRDAPDRDSLLRAALAARYRQRLREHGVADVAAGIASLELDIRLNAQGLAIWLDKQPR